MSSPRIAIIGAGPAGCMLGRILSLSNVPFTIYESDASPNYRSQGGTLDLHPGTGLAAMKEAQLWDEFMEHARFDGDYMIMADKNLKPFIQIGPSNKLNERPEIDRFQLRRILTESLPEGSIKWGHRLQRVEEGNTLIFDHATESGFDLIIGCEGGWSKVRSYISSAVKPQYTGVGYHRLTILDAATTAPDLYKVVNRGSLFASSNGQRMAVQQMGDGSINVSWTARRPENWTQTCGYNPHNIDQVKNAILKEMEDWCPLLRGAIEKACDGVCDPKNLYQLPVGWHWEHRRGATLIGDAAHLMTPFAGEGVNVAFDDARKLATAIIRAVQAGGEADQLDKNIQAFEEEMFTRMVVYQRQTDDVTKLWFFSEGNMWDVIPKIMLVHAKARVPTVLYPLAWGLINSYWFIKARLSG
ncbi:FAD/NAD(P)-binding domain-containing protein [Annulohypoxylon truncatum]|uniref:FAD/NAD(P)-binding domain-containing protein n=1 Tax=Annulohypoxylon truncatum TaxID=327061 RepID=UPI002007794E|nr:FAD/NAD(P)-binding domain-containing protein [Annulohypoxylon truncatum]KAI1210505.1 FAD/NAD(P)-binding domain-containing protein [Annulohypoxylon truncatum]